MISHDDNREAARRSMTGVMGRYPELTDCGFDLRREHSFERYRAAMLAGRSLAQFSVARIWVRGMGKTKAINPRSGSSYGLKHVAAHEIGYVTNGVFIAAALAEGFDVRLTDPTSPNVWFNMSRRSVSLAHDRKERARVNGCYQSVPPADETSWATGEAAI
jgi:hypothetical protein